jgi:hypothetical protein
VAGSRECGNKPLGSGTTQLADQSVMAKTSLLFTADAWTHSRAVHVKPVVSNAELRYLSKMC